MECFILFYCNDFLTQIIRLNFFPDPLKSTIFWYLNLCFASPSHYYSPTHTLQTFHRCHYVIWSRHKCSSMVHKSMLYLAITIPCHFWWKTATLKHTYSGNSTEVFWGKNKKKTRRDWQIRKEVRYWREWDKSIYLKHDCAKLTWRNFYKERNRVKLKNYLYNTVIDKNIYLILCIVVDLVIKKRVL